MVTDDEKWIIYHNVGRKREWTDKDKQPIPVAKVSLHPKKILLSVWWYFYMVLLYVWFDLLRTARTKSNHYIEQFSRLNIELIKKRPRLVNIKKVLFQHDNARPHTGRITLQKISEFNWELLPHSAYSPDIPPSDFHLFRALQFFLLGKKLKQDVQNELTSFFF